MEAIVTPTQSSERPYKNLWYVMLTATYQTAPSLVCICTQGDVTGSMRDKMFIKVLTEWLHDVRYLCYAAK